MAIFSCSAPRPKGEQVITLYIAPDKLFGLAAALGRTTDPAAATATVDCFALWWLNHLWAVFTVQNAGFATQTFKFVGDRNDDLQSMIQVMAIKMVEQRVAFADFRLINRMGRQRC